MAAVRKEAEAKPAAVEPRGPSEAGTGETPEAIAKGGRAKRLIIVAIVLLTAGGIAGAVAFYLLRAVPTVAQSEGVAAVATHKPAIYLDLRPDFIVNSTAVGQRRYLQTNVAVMARDQAVIDAVNTHAPIIRSAIVNLLADEDFMVLQTDAGKQALREKMRATMDATLSKEANLTGIEAVLLTSFVMQ